MNGIVTTAILSAGCLLASCAATGSADPDPNAYEPLRAAPSAHAYATPATSPANARSPASSSGASTTHALSPSAPALGAYATSAMPTGHEASYAAMEPAPAASFEPAQDGGLGPDEGEWEFTLGGSGSNDNDFDVGGGSMSGSVGYFLSDHSEVGVRQGLSFSDFGDSVWNGSTRVFYDYHFGEGKLRPLLGLNFGWVYGDTVDETLAAAPEAGLKWFVTDEAFVFGLVEYQFFFDDASDADDAFDDGSFVYTFGIGIVL